MLIKKYYNNKIPEVGEYDNNDLELIANVKKTSVLIFDDYNNLKIHNAIENSISLFRLVNKFLEVKQPWKTVKDDCNQKTITATTLYLSAEILRIGSIFLFPVMPTKTQLVLNDLNFNNNYDVSFGILKENTKISFTHNLFPKII
tara:strand:- start:2037 stop:2471 length:435 start_codon:yes stop_codon:yes gene_type:complete